MGRGPGARRASRPPAAATRPPVGLVPFALALFVCWGTLGLYAVHGQMPRNVIELPFESRLRPLLPYLTPEGWAFFTRSAREPKLVTYRLASDGRWQSADLGPHSRPTNLFGLDRRSRAQGVEIALLLGTIRTDRQVECKEAIPKCLESLRAVPIRNVSPAPSLCGDVGVAQQEPLPWAWSGAASEVTMPSKVVRLAITC
jgi:sporulation delaying protein A